MPRSALRVQGASTRTRWTLEKEEVLPPYTPREGSAAEGDSDAGGRRGVDGGSIMQANGHGHGHSYGDHEPPLPRYESYDGSGYGSPLSSQRSSAQYQKKPAPAVDTPHQGSGEYADFHFDASFPDPPRQPNSQQQKAQPPIQQPTKMMNGNGNARGHFEDIKFGYPMDEQITSHHISLITKVHNQNHDVVGRHLLYENALLDTQEYEILEINEVDELKKEHARLNARIEAANRKLTLESKVKDAAQNLQKLYSSDQSGHRDRRPDTPQSPESRGHRNSLLGSRRRAGTSSSSDAQHQAEDELGQAIRKVDELNLQIRDLMDRRLTVERKLLRHTAAVLADQASRPRDHDHDHDLQPNGHRGFGEEEMLAYGPDEFDGIRDILKGAPAAAKVDQAELESLRAEHEQQLITMREQLQMQQEQTLNAVRQRSEQQLASMQTRLDQLNTKLRGAITDASQIRGQQPEPEPVVQKSESVQSNVDNTFILLENNMSILEREREKNKEHYKRVQDSAALTRNDVEKQLEGVNSQLYGALQTCSGMQALQDLVEPPQVTGHGYQEQLQYLEESLFRVEKLLREHNEQLQLAQEASRGVEDAHQNAAKHSQKAGEYETVLAGLWEIVSADNKSSGLTPRESTDVNGVQRDLSARSSTARSPVSPVREDFSLSAFSARVQHLFDISNGAKEQQDILRRQIQQQRDLNGKSDVEKDAQIEELQTRYEALNYSYDSTQQDLARTMAAHEQSEKEAMDARNEMEKVMNELEQLHKTIDETQRRTKEVDERHTAIITEKNQLQVERDSANDRLEEVQKGMEELESEVVRLTTELTMAKAELDGAYGSRSERKKEAGLQEKEMEALATLKDQEIAQLRREHAEKAKLLEQELQDMMNEFQEMTRESLELEKERGQLESLIDSLRERVEQLETQLDEEKVNAIGMKSPEGTAPKDSTSVMVLRQEFKKMMRESRAEGLRHIRNEQEERRRLETEMRKMRQAVSPLGRQGRFSQGSLAHARIGSIASTTNGISAGTNTLSPSTVQQPSGAGN